MISFQAIAAMSQNRVIGRDNKIPWHLPEDFRWFKKMTTGHVVLMGRKTFQSLGRPLPDRITIVLSRGGFFHPGVRTISSLEALDAAVLGIEGRTIFVCGGGQLYAQALPRCTDLYLTLVKQQVQGDAFFPPFEQWFEPFEEILDRPDFTIMHYRRSDLPVLSPCPLA